MSADKDEQRQRWHPPMKIKDVPRDRRRSQFLRSHHRERIAAQQQARAVAGMDELSWPMYSTTAMSKLPEGYIRLLQILPGNQSEICCAVSAFPTVQCPPYMALSYAWGKPFDSCTLTVNGHRRAIRPNLRRFLYEARKIYAGQPFWIDALCINQGDVAERTQQLQLMPDIYRQASYCLIWLGPAYGGSDEAMDALAGARCNKQNPSRIWKRIMNVGHAIAPLTMREYWERLWTVQEVVLSRRKILMCGGKLAPWEPFLDILITRPEAKYMKSCLFVTIQNSPALFVAWRISQTEPRCLFDALPETRGLRCSDPRDRVYALSGLFPLGSRSLTADYQKCYSMVLNDVLRSHHFEVEAPNDLQVIESQCLLLNGLDLRASLSDSIFLIEGQTPENHTFAEAMNKHPLVSSGSTLNLWWAVLNQHTATTILIMRDPAFEPLPKLKQAVQDGSFDTVRLILDANTCLMAHDLQSVLREGVSEVYSHEVHQVTYSGLLEFALSVQQHKILRLLVSYQRELQTGVRDSLALFAMHNKDGALLELLLDRGLEVRHALTVAIQQSHPSIVEHLLSKVASVGQLAVSQMRELLHEAISMNDEAIVSLLLASGADMEGSIAHLSERNLNAVALAVQKGSVGTLKLLLASGADANATDHEGNHMLTQALCSRHMAMMTILHQNGNLRVARRMQKRFGTAGMASVSLQYNCGLWNQANGHMLVYAANTRRHSHKLIEFLLKHQVYGGLDQRLLNSALACAAKYDNVRTLRLLLNAGADVNGQSAFHDTPLARSIFSYASGDVVLSVVRLLLRAGADPNAAVRLLSSDYCLPLAAERGSPSVLKLLLNAGADVNSSRTTCDTTLRGLARHGYNDILQSLLPTVSSITTDVLCQIAFSCTSLTLRLALGKSHTPHANGTYRSRADLERESRRSGAVEAAIRGGRIKNVQLLLKNGIRVPKTALHIAVHAARQDIVEKLLASGAVVDAHKRYEVDQWYPWSTTPEVYFGTALGAALSRGYGHIAKALRKSGARRTTHKADCHEEPDMESETDAIAIERLFGSSFPASEELLRFTWFTGCTIKTVAAVYDCRADTFRLSSVLGPAGLDVTWAGIENSS